MFLAFKIILDNFCVWGRDFLYFCTIFKKSENHPRKLLTSEPYMVDSPCLFGKGAGAAIAARIIAKERLLSTSLNWDKETFNVIPLICTCPQEDKHLVRYAYQPLVTLVFPGWVPHLILIQFVSI